MVTGVAAGREHAVVLRSISTHSNLRLSSTQNRSRIPGHSQRSYLCDPIPEIYASGWGKRMRTTKARCGNWPHASGSASVVSAISSAAIAPPVTSPRTHMGKGSRPSSRPVALRRSRPWCTPPPEVTLQEFCTRLATTQQVTVSRATISRALTKLGLPRKKNLSRRRASAAKRPTATSRVPSHRQVARP